MEFDDHEEEHEGLTPSYDSLGNSNSTRPNNKMDVSAHRKPRYRECLKNHAVGIGGHAVDGCGEFMAAGEEGTLDALKCAACNCHRNFHRKETDSSAAAEAFNFQPQQPLLTHYPHGQYTPIYRTPSGYLHVGAATPSALRAPPQPLALPSSSGGGREEQEDMWHLGSGGGTAKKRFRTKFTQEQREKMMELAERLGWRIQKQDEEVVQQFCNEFGVKRQVFKVWMHNNKHTHGKKP